jgi:EAL domain-containing protein (putative c-di-GMP-specific phosphodiesterase class I)
MQATGDDTAPFDDEEPWLSGAPRLAYQPVVDLGSGRLLGFEALLRWWNPATGLMRPGLLIPWAEANGDIVAIGEWVLEEGCRHAAAWPNSLQLAVNCSIVQLRKGEASKSVMRALEASGLEPDRLTIEVTEQAMTDEVARVDLTAIAELGVQLAVDDVGTSWSSFELLRRMAINTVKIDGSFVSQLEPRQGINRMVVETVVHLAHSAGMSTVAEGVETSLAAQIVREFDSDAAQGYFFAPPLDVTRATELATTPGIRFPLDGPGWRDGGVAWPAQLGLDAHFGDLAGHPDISAAIDAAVAETPPLVELAAPVGAEAPAPRHRRRGARPAGG